MSDKLDWQNQHLILLEHLCLEEAQQKGGYKMPSMLSYKYPEVKTVEELFFRLGHDKDYRSGCELLGAALHKRALVWWGYCVLLDLFGEVGPAEDKPVIDDDFAKGKPFELPKWAKMPEETPPDPQILADFEKSVATAQAHLSQVLESVPPDALRMLEESRDQIEAGIKAQYGMTPREMLQKLVAEFNPGLDLIDRVNSPIFREMDKLKAKLEEVRQDNIQKIKDIFPPEAPGHAEKLRNCALDAVWAWIVAPESVNAQRCLNAGNEAKGSAEGMLAYVAFWSFGNLSASPEAFVPTPPGLITNGSNGMLLMSALAKGGTKSFKERYETYYRLGLEVAAGRLNWSELLEDKVSPHRKITAPRTSQTGEGRFREAPRAFDEKPAPKGFGR